MYLVEKTGMTYKQFEPIFGINNMIPFHSYSYILWLCHQRDQLARSSVLFLSFLTTASQMGSTAIDFCVTTSISIVLTMNSVSLVCGLFDIFLYRASRESKKHINRCNNLMIWSLQYLEQYLLHLVKGSGMILFWKYTNILFKFQSFTSLVISDILQRDIKVSSDSSLFDFSSIGYSCFWRHDHTFYFQLYLPLGSWR